MSLDETSEIANIKRLIANASTEIESIIQRLNIQLTAENIQRDVVRALVDMQCKLQSRIQELSGTLEHLYEREVQPKLPVLLTKKTPFSALYIFAISIFKFSLAY